MTTLKNELDWLERVLDTRRKINLKELGPNEIEMTRPPSLSDDSSAYFNFLTKYNFDPTERLLIILALTPHVQPKILDVFKSDKPLTAFGGVKGKNHNGFIPTGETFVFILGEELEIRSEVLKFFDKTLFFLLTPLTRI